MTEVLFIVEYPFNIFIGQLYWNIIFIQKLLVHFTNYYNKTSNTLN